MTKTVVGVYGTLKSGMWNNGYIRNQKFLKTVVMHNVKLYRNYPDFPVAQWHEGSNSIVELWEVDDECLRRLDRLEGVPHMYQRKVVDVSRLYVDESVHMYFGNPECWPFDRLKECGKDEHGAYNWQVNDG